MSVKTDAIARGSAEQFVNRHAKKFSFDFSQRLLDAAQRAREQRTAAIERVAINRLPVMHDVARIFADEIRSNLFDGRGASFRAAFQHGFAQTDDSRIGVDFEKKPAWFNEEGFELRDFQLLLKLRWLALNAWQSVGAVV